MKIRWSETKTRKKFIVQQLINRAPMEFFPNFKPIVAAFECFSIYTESRILRCQYREVGDEGVSGPPKCPMSYRVRGCARSEFYTHTHTRELTFQCSRIVVWTMLFLWYTEKHLVIIFNDAQYDNHLAVFQIIISMQTTVCEQIKSSQWSSCSILFPSNQVTKSSNFFVTLLSSKT